MITDEHREQSQLERIEILRAGYGDAHAEVAAWDETHPKPVDAPADGILKTPVAGDRLTVEEVEQATETVPASPQGKIGGKKAEQ